MTRVAVTGIGIVSPLGLDAPTTWSAALAGESGIDWISAFDTEGLPVRIAGEVKGFDPLAVASAKDARKLERNVLFALSAAREALADSGLDGLRPEPGRDHLRLGDRRRHRRSPSRRTILRERGPDRVSPSFLPNVLVDTASGQLAISLGIKGVNYAIVSACATGSHAIGEAAELIKRGDADAVIAGGTEACVDPLILAGFTAMRGLAAEDEHPPRASRPFDATRAGFVMAEGAGAVLRRGLGPRRGARRRDLRRGARLRRLERRPPPRPARARGRGRRGDDAHARSSAPASSRSASATSTRTAPRPRSATSPRRRRSRTSSATTPTGSPSPRRSR